MTTPTWISAEAVPLDDWGASPTATEGNPTMRGKILSVNADGSSECGNLGVHARHPQGHDHER